jgi:hypothetical protein
MWFESRSETITKGRHRPPSQLKKEKNQRGIEDFYWGEIGKPQHNKARETGK